MSRPTLATYVRHAERFGTELVFETARDELEPVQLGYLSLRLQRLDPTWRPPGDRSAFALALLVSGVDSKQARRMARIGRSTLHRAQHPAKSGPEGAFQSGGSVSDRPTPTDRTLAALSSSAAPQMAGVEGVAP